MKILKEAGDTISPIGVFNTKNRLGKNLGSIEAFVGSNPKQSQDFLVGLKINSGSKYNYLSWDDAIKLANDLKAALKSKKKYQHMGI